MPETRHSASLKKNQIKTLVTLCKSLIDGTKAVGFFENPATCAASYVKLEQARKKLLLIRGDELPETDEGLQEFLRLEEMDRECLAVLEELQRSLPADHALRKTTTHLRDLGSGDGIPERSGNRLKKPSLPEFDGKNASWLWWKIIFEREVISNAELSPEHRYSHLISSIKKKTVASRIVLNYAGVANAFDLSWKDLNDQFNSAADLKSSHLQALRDLNKKNNVAKADDVRRLEDLYHAAWGHVNALKALGVEATVYQPLTIISVRECLPSLLREDYLRKHDAGDLEQTAFEDLFVFLKEEIRVRRRSWQIGPRGKEKNATTPEHRGSGKEGHKEKKKFHPREKGGEKRSSKHTSMLQDDQTAESVDDLNE